MPTEHNDRPPLPKEWADAMIPFKRDMEWNIKPISKRRLVWWRLLDRIDRLRDRFPLPPGGDR